jgi:hypothetical protein
MGRQSGPFVSGHGSLDYRIREVESFERTIHRFMHDLNDCLIEGYHLVELI